MQFQVTIDCDNAAFYANGEMELDQGAEVARILRSLAESVEDMGDLSGFDCKLRDFNSNAVGSATFVEE